MTGGPVGKEGCVAERPAGLLFTLGFVSFTYAFQQTAVLPAMATVEHAFHAAPAWSAWLLSGYLMVATVLTPAFGRLADLRGEARVLRWSLLVFLAGSLGAAVLPSFAGVVLCRAVQGAGGAVLPLAFALARRHLPDEQVGRAIARITGAFGIGATLGFATGGVMTEALSWRAVFASGAVLVAVGLVLLVRRIPVLPGGGSGRFDLPGAVLLGGASLGVLLALTLGQEVGWVDPVPVLLLVASAVAGALWVRTELRHDEPLVDLRVLRDRTVLLVNGATVGLGWARFVGLLLIPELVQGPGRGRYGFGAGAAAAGLFLLPDGLGTLVGGPAAGRLARRLSAPGVLAWSLATVAAGAVAIAVGSGSAPVVAAAALVLGLGGGAATQASSAVVTACVPPGDAGASSSLNSTLRRFAGGVAGQLSTVALAGLAGAGAPASRQGFVVAFAVAAALAAGGGLLAGRVRAPAGSPAAATGRHGDRAGE